MADISNVRVEQIKDIYESLEALSCEFRNPSVSFIPYANATIACIVTRVLY